MTMHDQGRWDGIAAEMDIETVKLDVRREGARSVGGSTLTDGAVMALARNGEKALVSDFADKVGLNYRVTLEDIQTARGISGGEKFIACTRSDTGAILGIVTRRFHPSQPMDIVTLAHELGLAERGIGGGIWDDGAAWWLQCKALDAIETPSGKMERNIFLGSGADGKTGTRLGATATVVICRNTYVKACRSMRSIAHRSTHDEKVNAAKKALAEALGSLDVLRSFVDKAANQNATEGTALTVYENIYGKRPAEKGPALTRWDNDVGRFINGYWRAPGAAPGSAWGVMQAVTYHTQHERTRRDSDGFRASIEGVAGEAEATAIRVLNLGV